MHYYLLLLQTLLAWPKPLLEQLWMENITSVMHHFQTLKNRCRSNLISFQESLRNLITLKLSKSIMNSWKKANLQELMFTPGNFMITLSLSQESDDLTSSNNTWTSFNISKTTLTKTSQTNRLLRTSSKLLKLRIQILPQNITMENLWTQPLSIQLLIIQLLGLMSSSETSRRKYSNFDVINLSLFNYK